MPFMTRMILFALHAAVITTLTQTTSQVVAAPLPLPKITYSRPVLSSRNLSRPFPPRMRIVRNMTSSSAPTSPYLVFARATSSEAELIKPAVAGTENSTADPYVQLVNFHQATKQNCENLKKLAAQSAMSKANDAAFQRKCIAQLNAFHSNISRQQAAFSAFVDEKHKTISSRSKNHAMEELIQDSLATSKDGLKYIYIIVKNIPILGLICGPIIYDLKCLLDSLLNFCRDLLIDISKGLLLDIAKLLGA